MVYPRPAANLMEGWTNTAVVKPCGSMAKSARVPVPVLPCSSPLHHRRKPLFPPTHLAEVGTRLRVVAYLEASFGMVS